MLTREHLRQLETPEPGPMQIAPSPTIRQDRFDADELRGRMQTKREAA